MKRCDPRTPAGFAMIEVLVSILILAFGLLGLAGMQMHMQTAELESYQRAQALVLVEDMAERIATNRSIAANYVSADEFGTGDSQPADCTAYVIGTVERDQCEWSNALKGSAEVTTGGSNVGAMTDARGCVREVTAPNSASGICQPGVYRVDVVWQGMAPTVAPSVDCGEGNYGDETYRRAVSRVITIGLPGCS